MKRSIIIVICIICVLVCGIMVWIDSSLLNAIATIMSGLITGVLSSTMVTLYFNDFQKKQREKIKKLKLESFIYACADLIYWIELDINDIKKSKLDVFNDKEDVIQFIDDLKKDNKEKVIEELDEKCDHIVNTGISYISPLFSAYISFDQNSLLLQDVITIEEYNFFNNFIINDMCKDFIEIRKQHRFFEGARAEYLFHRIKVALNIVYDSIKIFPQIKEMYIKIKKHNES